MGIDESTILKKKLDVEEMRMLRCTFRFTKLDRIIFKIIRGTPEVRQIFKKVDESDGNVVRREE